MRGIFEAVGLFLFYPEKAMRSKAREFRQTRQKRYKRKEYMCKRVQRKLRPFGLVSRQEMDAMKSEINTLRNELNKLSER